jgi:hypothetical protein
VQVRLKQLRPKDDDTKPDAKPDTKADAKADIKADVKADVASPSGESQSPVAVDGVGGSGGLGEGEREGEVEEEGGMSEQEAQSIIRSLYWEVCIQLPSHIC